MNTPTIAITGANGFLGGELVDYFAAQGWNVIALVRGGASKRGDAPQNVRYAAYDLRTDVDESLLRGVDYLVHAAYIKFTAADADALDVNLTAAQRLVAAADAAGVGQRIFISTMSAHDEATSVYGKQKLAVEAVFAGTTSAVLKCGLIIGNGGIVKEMSDFMRSKHAVPLIGGGNQPLQIVAVQDLVQVIARVCEKRLTGTFVVATPRVYRYREFYRALADHLRTKVLFVPMPYGLLQTIFRVAAALHLPLGVGEDNLEGLKKLRSMESASDLAKIGVTLRPLDEALNSL